MDQNKRYIKKLENHIENTRKNITYSINRFDILVISLASGGLVFTMGFVKNLFHSESEINFLLINLAWIFFSSSIVANFVSQVTSYFANKLEVKVSKNIIREKRGKSMKGDQKKLENRQKSLNIFTNILNGISILTILSAIILSILFINQNL